VLASRIRAAILRRMNAQAPSQRATVLTLVTAALLLISTSAHAVFYTPYQNWTASVTKDPNSGTGSGTAQPIANYFPGGNSGVSSSMTILGLDNLTGLEGTLNLISQPMYAAGTVSFTWSYTTPDTGNGRESFDKAGYFIISGNSTTATQVARNNNPSQNSSSPVNLNVAAGDRIGFYIYTRDNTGGAPTFTISAFSGPLAAVPEASAYLTLAFAGLVVAGIARRRKAAR
jgi:hypothetical protein